MDRPGEPGSCLTNGGEELVWAVEIEKSRRNKTGGVYLDV